MDISIRNLDDAAGAKLTQLAKKKHISREAYCRSYLESLAVMEDMHQLDLKYASLVKGLAEVIDNNTKELKSIHDKLDEVIDN